MSTMLENRLESSPSYNLPFLVLKAGHPSPHYTARVYSLISKIHVSYVLVHEKINFDFEMRIGIVPWDKNS